MRAIGKLTRFEVCAKGFASRTILAWYGRVQRQDDPRIEEDQDRRELQHLLRSWPAKHDAFLGGRPYTAGEDTELQQVPFTAC